MTTRLQRTQGTATNRKKFTFSAWVKKASNVTGNDQVIYDTNLDADNRITVYFRGSTNNTLNIYGASSGSQIIFLETTRLLRDISGWYHIVLAFDTTQATAADRVKIYINGTQETAFNSPSYPNQDIDLPTGTSSYVHSIGYYTHGGSSVFEGCMSHIHFTDGYAYAASDFGSTDNTTGEWKINTNPNVTYGNNGFFILKDGNSVTDQSPNTNNFTVDTGTLTKSEDNPSNVFATLNRLNNLNTNITFANGCLKLTVSGNWLGTTGTLGVTSGKYYWEVKNTGGGNFGAGIGKDAYGTSIRYYSVANNWLYDRSTNYGYYKNGSNYYKGNNSTTTSYGADVGSNDVLMIAWDHDNGKIFLGKNGTWFDSGNPASGTNPAYTITTEDAHWFPIFVGENNNIQVNFGNGYFGSTAVSSAGTNASNLGIFEYDVPSGFTALCTKGLNE